MPIRNGQYVKRTQEELFQSSVDKLLSLEPDANPQSTSTYTYALLKSTAQTTFENQEESLQNVYNSGYVEDATGENLTKKAKNLGVIRKDAIAATGVVTFSRESEATTDYVIPSGTVVETIATDSTQYETIESVTLTEGTTSVSATVEAIEAGSDGNVGPNAIGAMPSPPTGVGTVTNNNPIGDPSITDTNGNPLISGRDREDDEELRQRVLDTDATNKGPSASGVKLALQETDGVISVDLNTNQTSTTENGLEPYHTEVVVYGGPINDIVETLSETMGVTTLLRLQGGVYGQKETTTKYIPLLDQTIDVPISRPLVEQLDIEIDVVHRSDYDGPIEVKDAVVEYIGGTYADDSTTNGTLIGENILINKIENVIEDIQGVDYAEVTFIDGNGDGTDDETTTSNGVPVYDVDNSSLARVDADDILLSETQV